MRKLLLYVFLLQVALISAAQLNQLEVGLKNGQTLYPKLLKFKDPMFGERYLLLNDSEKIKLSEVDYYQTSSEHFIVATVGLFSNEPLRRVEAGEISVYLYESVVYNNHMMMGPNGMMTPGFGTTQKRDVYFYKKGDDRLKKLKIGNLKTDLQDYTPGMTKIKKASNKRLVRLGLWVAGGVVLLTGINQWSKDAAEVGPDNQASVNFPMILGMGMIAAPFFIKTSEEENLLDAIRLYNADLDQVW